VIDIIKSENLLNNVNKMSTYLLDAFNTNSANSMVCAKFAAWV